MTNLTLTQTGDDDEPASVWTDERGTEYLPVMLCHNSNGALFITGVAVLVKPPGGTLQPAADAASALSRFYASRGAKTLSGFAE